MEIYEIIIRKDGKEQKVYANNEEGKQIALICADQILSCSKAVMSLYKSGSDKFGGGFVYKPTEEEYDERMEAIADEPFCFDTDLSYFVLCEHDSIKAANEFLEDLRKEGYEV